MGSPSPPPSTGGPTTPSNNYYLYKDKVYLYQKSSLISQERASTPEDCLDKCKTTDGCVAINWQKKKCFLLSGFKKLVKRDGWYAGYCPDSPNTSPNTIYPTPTSPSGTSPYPSPSPTGTSPYPSPSPPVTTLKKNKFYASKKTALIGKSGTKSAEDCLRECVDSEGCVAMNYDNKKKNCFLLSSFTELEDKRGWTAGLVEAGPPPTLPTTGPSTYPPTETPVTGATTEGGCEDKFFKNQAYEYERSDIIGKPYKSKSVKTCLATCLEGTEGCVAVNWNKKCFLLKDFQSLGKKKGWSAATCA